MSLHGEKYLRLFIVLVGTLIFPGSLFSQNITVSDNVTINVPVAGRDFTLLSTSNALDQVQVTDSTIIITTNLSSGTVSLRSAEGLDIGGTKNDANIALTSCDATGSVLVIQANITAARTVTITPPTTGTLICSTSATTSSTGTGSSGSSSGGGTGATPPPPPPPPAVDQSVVEPEVKEPRQAPKFTDISKLSKRDKEAVAQIAELMTKANSIASTAKKFSPKAYSNPGFALQVVLAISGVGCGEGDDYPGIKGCKKRAVEAGLIAENYRTAGQIKRIAYYELLLLGLGLEPEDGSTSEVKKYCKDAKNISKREAGIYLTAAEYEIIKPRKGATCRLDEKITKLDVVRLALKAIAQ